MEQEKEHLSKLKIELEKTVENLCCEEDKVGNTYIYTFTSTKY